MTVSLLGQLSGSGSFVVRKDHMGNRIPYKVGFRFRQPADLPMCLSHGDRIGTWEWWASGRTLGTWVGGRSHDDDLVDLLAGGDVWLSPTAWGLDVGPLQVGGAVCEEASTTPWPATTNIRRVLWRATDVAADSGKPAGATLNETWLWGLFHDALSAARFRLDPYDYQRSDDVEVERQRLGVKQILHPSQGLLFTDLDSSARNTSRDDPAAPAGSQGPPVPGQGQGGVRFNGRDLSPQMSRRVEELLDEGVGLDDIVRFIRRAA